MKGFQPLILGAGALLLLLSVAVGVTFTASFQTWAARRALASRPEWRATLGSLSSGLQRTAVTGLRLEPERGRLDVPHVEADFPLWTAVWDRKFVVSRLVAKGCTLDLSQPGKVPPGVRVSGVKRESGPAKSKGAEPVAGISPQVNEAVRAFAGLFSQLELPGDLSIDGVELEGDVILPDSQGRFNVRLTGGRLAVASVARFDFTARAHLRDAEVQTMEVRGELIVALDPERRFVRLEAKLKAAATGPEFPDGVKLDTELTATRTATGEAYAATMIAAGREVLNVAAEFSREAQKLDGKWKLDLRDFEVAPFVWSRSLPAFVATGQGTFETGAGIAAVRFAGRLIASVDRLDVIRPELAALGAVRLDADFDLAEHLGVVGVRKLELAINGAQPAATLRGLQAFDLNPRTGEVRAADGTRELLGISLHGVPLAWVKPWLKDITLSGGVIRGELVAAPRGSGIGLRSVSPITIDRVTVARADLPLARDVDVRFGGLADYSPQGWQTEIQGLTASHGEATLLTLEAKAGQLLGSNEAIKSAGKLSVNLAALASQPVAANRTPLTSGEAVVEFAASVNARTEIQASIGLKKLGTVADGQNLALPAVTFDLRADLGADGKIAFNAPIAIEREGRKSDLTVAATVEVNRDKTRTIVAEVVSTHFVREDVQVLAAGFPFLATPARSTPALSPWSGWLGTVKAQLRKVVWSNDLSLTNVAGSLRIDPGGLQLEGGQAIFEAGGNVTASGLITYNGLAPKPYALMAYAVVKDFNLGPLLRVWNGDRIPPLEGRFDLSSRLTARTMTLGDMVPELGGDFHFTSKGGLFRGLPVSTSTLVESPSRLAGLFASAGSMLGGLTGKKEPIDIASRAEAVDEFARGLNPVVYDQLSVKVSRDAALNITLHDFTLISPEFRLMGNGTVLHHAGRSLLDDPLAMVFQLRARGRQGELLKYLGVLENQPDDLGYSVCTLPFNITGTVGRPDVTELNGRLTALAIEKGTFADKAADFFNKLRGSGK